MSNLKKYSTYTIDRDLISEYPKIVSAGIGEDMSFEIELSKDYSISTIVCYDFTKKAERCFDKTNLPNTIWIGQGLSNNKEIQVFVLPESVNLCSTSEFKSHENNKHSIGKETVKCVNIIELLETEEYIDCLKLDIEGSEYGFLMEMTEEHSNKIKQIVGEFHQYRIPELDKSSNILLIEHLEDLGYNFIPIDYKHGNFLFTNSI